MKECVNDELDYDNKKHFIEKAETKLNDDDEDDTQVNEKEGY